MAMVMVMGYLSLEFNVCLIIVIMMLERVPRDLLSLPPKARPTLEAITATKRPMA